MQGFPNSPIIGLTQNKHTQPRSQPRRGGLGCLGAGAAGDYCVCPLCWSLGLLGICSLSLPPGKGHVENLTDCARYFPGRPRYVFLLCREPKQEFLTQLQSSLMGKLFSPQGTGLRPSIQTASNYIVTTTLGLQHPR